MALGLQPAQNFLVPAVGTTRIHAFRQTMTAGVTHSIDFREIGLDGVPYVPYSAIMDNTLGTADLIVTIGEIGYRMICPPGQQLQLMYPAPRNQVVYIDGEGDVVIVFADYPVMPYASFTRSI